MTSRNIGVSFQFAVVMAAQHLFRNGARVVVVVVVTAVQTLAHVLVLAVRHLNAAKQTQREQ